MRRREDGSVTEVILLSADRGKNRSDESMMYSVPSFTTKSPDTDLLTATSQLPIYRPPPYQFSPVESL